MILEPNTSREPPCKIDNSSQDHVNDKSVRKSRNLGNWESTKMQVVARIARNNVNNVSTASQNNLTVYVTLFASMLVLISVVIGMMYKVIIFHH